MNQFTYVVARTNGEAIEFMRKYPGASFLAGGTNLVDLLKLQVAHADTLVDVSRLDNEGIEQLEHGIRIGAATTNSDIAADRTVREFYPMLSLALLSGASGQLRNMATLGGNLLQRTRCRYFQDISMSCNKRDPGSGCAARDGDHHNHAIFGTSSQCIATHASDMAVALTALDATIEIEDEAGPRFMSIHDFYRLPDDTPEVDTNLRPGSLITGVRLDSATSGWESTYVKVRERSSFAFALVSTAAALQLEGGKISGIRIALGGVAHRPWRARIVEQSLLDKAPGTSEIRAAVEAELLEAHPLRDNAYKIPLVANTVENALVELYRRAQAE